jgi:hypothetical protein
MGRISEAITQLVHLASAGSFKPVRSNILRRSAHALAVLSVPRACSANTANFPLVGVKFEESPNSQMVIGVNWSAELGKVVVRCCDVAMAADLELDEAR